MALLLPKSRYTAGERMTLRVRAERPCQLLVLALGNGGEIDILYPNARHSGLRGAGSELELPPQPGDLRLRLRGARFDAPEEERIIAIAQPVGAASPLRAAEPGAATVTIAPDSEQGRHLEAMLRTPEPDRIVGEVRYQVAPPTT